MVEPDIAIVLTSPFAFGFQFVALPVEASSAAIWFRGCPPDTGEISSGIDN